MVLCVDRMRVVKKTHSKRVSCSDKKCLGRRQQAYKVVRQREEKEYTSQTSTTTTTVIRAWKTIDIDIIRVSPHSTRIGRLL